MGKCLRRSCRTQRSPSSPAVVEAYLTLRSGRRVPAAGSSPRRRHRRGGRCCGKSAASAGTAARQRRRCRRALASSHDHGHREEEQRALEQEDPVVCNEDSGVDRTETHHSGETKRGHDSDGVAGRPSSSPPEAEMEAFFAAAELAERRRFAETYNYDIALDSPLEGRFEWAPLST